MKKRLLILFVTLLLSACLLAGCGEDKDGSSKTEAAKETVSQSATTAATTAAEANTEQKPIQAETTAKNKNDNSADNSSDNQQSGGNDNQQLGQFWQLGRFRWIRRLAGRQFL